MKYTLVFFTERHSPFGMLHLSALLAQRKYLILAIVVTSRKVEKNRSRAQIITVRDLLLRGMAKMCFLVKLSRNWILSGFKKISAIPVIEVAEWNAESIQRIKDLRPDLLFSSGYTKILPSQVLDLARVGAFNTHPSMLPMYAGSNPWFWLIKNGEKSSGVTIHTMSVIVDAGAIVLQKPVRIPSNCNYAQLYSLTLQKSVSLIPDFTRKLRSGETKSVKPELFHIKLFRSPQKEDYRIDWSQEATSIMYLIRASLPAPGAYFAQNGINVHVIQAESREDMRFKGKSGLVEYRYNKMVVKCGGNSVLVIRKVMCNGRVLRIHQYLDEFRSENNTTLT